MTQTLGNLQFEVGRPLTCRRLRAADILRRLQASVIPERSIVIVLELDESLHVEGDSELFTWAVRNLLSNALKFTRSGGRITLSCRAESDGVAIEIEDECGGLPIGDPHQLLAPFERGQARSTSSGLGLVIARRAAEALGGALHVEDLPGHGCVFRLTFPLARSPSSFPPPLNDYSEIEWTG